MSCRSDSEILENVARVVGAPMDITRERLRAVAEAWRDREEEIRSSLAGPRLARRMVLSLPLVSVVMGIFLGFDPVGVLIGTPLGWGCLVGGVVLVGVGWRWMARLERRARGSPPAPGLPAEALALAISGGLPVSVGENLVKSALSHLVTSEWEQTAIARVRVVTRHSGFPIVRELRHVADEHRRQVHHAGLRASRELGERILVPMGACLLPAFLLWGVVPVVYGMMTDSLMNPIL